MYKRLDIEVILTIKTPNTPVVRFSQVREEICQEMDIAMLNELSA